VQVHFEGSTVPTVQLADMFNLKADSLVVRNCVNEDWCSEDEEGGMMVEHGKFYQVTGESTERATSPPKPLDPYVFAEAARKYLLGDDYSSNIPRRTFLQRLKRSGYQLAYNSRTGTEDLVKESEGRFVPVVTSKEQLVTLITSIHERLFHQGRDAIMDHLKQVAYAPRHITKKTVNECLQKCESCTVKMPKKMSKAPIQPIVTSRPLEKVLHASLLSCT